MKKADVNDTLTASEHITQQITELTDWRGPALARLRALILETAPNLTEEWKWGVGVWTHKGMVCSAGVFKDHIKLNFFKGTALQDVHGLFNAGLDAKATRAIDFNTVDEINAKAAQVKDLIHAAVAYNVSGGKSK